MMNIWRIICPLYLYECFHKQNLKSEKILNKYAISLGVCCSPHLCSSSRTCRHKE